MMVNRLGRSGSAIDEDPAFDVGNPQMPEIEAPPELSPEEQAAILQAEATKAAAELQAQTALQNAFNALKFNMTSSLAMARMQSQQNLFVQKASIRQITDAEIQKLEEQKIQERAAYEKAVRTRTNRNRTPKTRETILTGPLGIPQTGGSVISG